MTVFERLLAARPAMLATSAPTAPASSTLASYACPATNG
jgi:hypothetical protein